MTDEFIRTCIPFVYHIGSFEGTAVDGLQIPQNFRQLGVPEMENGFVSRVKVIEIVGSCNYSLAAVFVSFEEKTSGNCSIFQLRNYKSPCDKPFQTSFSCSGPLGCGPVFGVDWLVVIHLSTSFVNIVNHFSSILAEEADSFCWTARVVFNFELFIMF